MPQQIEYKTTPDITDVPKIVTELGAAFEEFKSTHTDEIKQLKAGAVDVLTREKLERLDTSLNTLSELKEVVERKLPARLDQMEAKVARAMLGLSGGVDTNKSAAELSAFNIAVKSFCSVKNRQAPADFDPSGYDQYKAAFKNYLRKGDRALTPDEWKAASVVGDPDGGYLVPADSTGRIVARMFETSPLREDAAIQVISSDALEGIYDLQPGVSGGWVSEKAARPETNTPQLGQWRIEVAAQYANPAATQRILDDGAIDVAAWLERKTADIMGRTENAAFVNGDGSGKPRGFCSYTTVVTDDATRAWGQLQHFNTGANAAFAATGPLDQLMDVIGAFKTAYINANTKWFAHRTAITAIRKARDGQGQYLWQPGLQLGQPQTLLTFPMRMYQDMPVLAAGSLSLALADMSQSYQIVQRSGIQTLRDPYTNKPFVHFYSTARVGGAVVDFDALKFIRFGT
jgi:HK97 family phage major capsid protein